MSLVGEERKRIILDMINNAGKVSTNELVDRLKVSSESIRRYLEELEAENRLKRVYGGAVKLTLEREELSHLKRELLRSDEKKRIGRMAAAMVQDHDVIVIDDGSTSLQMIHYLMNKKSITVVTNSVPGLNLLLDYQNKELFSGEVYFIGGKVDPKHFRISGSIAEKIMDSFYVNKAFISIDGLMLEHGITSYDAERALLAQKFIQKSKESIVLTDFSKVGNAKLYKMADLQEIDIVICDKAHPESWEEELNQKDVAWIVAGQ